MKALVSILRAVGSLWFAALLLILLLVAMACATVYESSNGTPQALHVFYRSWWFKSLLGLIAINVAASLLLRFPFPKRLTGFVVTHAAILLTLGGTLITQEIGVDGQVSITEGQTITQFLQDTPTLTCVKQPAGRRFEIDLTSSVFKGFEAAEHPAAPAMEIDDGRIEIARYIPASTWARQVVETADHSANGAVEVSLASAGHENATWIFADRNPFGNGASVIYRTFHDRSQLDQILNGQPNTSQPATSGIVEVKHNGITYEHEQTLEECLAGSVPIGTSGYSLRVLEYLPHARVEQERGLVNVSDQPINPAIVFELSGHGTTIRRNSFAKFPDFSHSKDELTEIEVRLKMPENDAAPLAPIEILGGPTDELYVRFQVEDEQISIKKLSLGNAVETPWPGWKFVVLQRYAHAREDWKLEPDDTPNETPIPAVRLNVITPANSKSVWVRKYEPRRIVVGENAYEVAFSDKQTPLGFSMKLDQLHVGTYPGETMPRSYESRITTIDPSTGREQSHVISMNHPVTHGAYTFYQSSIARQSDGTRVSVLGVSHDSGQAVVFLGYFMLLIGMVIVLLTRMMTPTGHATPTAKLSESGVV